MCTSLDLGFKQTQPNICDIQLCSHGYLWFIAFLKTLFDSITPYEYIKIYLSIHLLVNIWDFSDSGFYDH